MPLTLRKRGDIWHIRGTVPFRKTDGTIVNIRIEESTRETSKAKAARFAEDRWEYFREQAYRPKPKSVSFTDACITYVESKNPSKRDRQFLGKLITILGDKPISEIGQTEVADVAHRLYPGCKPSTHHRAVWAPVTAVLRLAGLEPHFKKPKIEKTDIKIPSDGWFDALFPYCDNQLKAFLLFINMTGRRPTEALEAIYDGNTKQAIILKTKTGGPVCVSIPECVLPYICTTDGFRLFSYGDRHNVYRALRRACKKAGLPCFGLHAIGRHSFATRLLKAGYSVKHVARAGGWASERMVLERYGHIEKDEAVEAAIEVGEEWLKQRKI